MITSTTCFRNYALAVVCMLFLTLCSMNAQTPSSAQSPSTASAAEETQQAASGSAGKQQPSDTQDENSVPSVNVAPTLDHPQVQQLGGAGSWFRDNVDWLHWGPLSLHSAEALFTYSTMDNTAPGAIPGNLNFHSGMLEGDIAYSQRFSHTRLIWQYRPRLLEADGNVSWQLTNQDSTFDVMFAPTTRMTVGISDWFSYYGKDNTVADRSFARNSYSGYLINPFLNTGQQTLMNSVAVPITYSLSAHTTLSVSPFVNFVQLYGSGNSASLSTTPSLGDGSSTQIGARTQLNHVFSARQSMGVFYAYQDEKESGPSGSSQFNSFGVTAERRIGKSLSLSGEAGSSRSVENNRATWSAVGSVTLARSWRYSSFQMTYGRDASFSGLLGNGYSEYGWANYSRQFGRKLTISSAFGYLSGPGQRGHNRGKYVNGTISYPLVRNVAWFFSYSSFWQAAGSPQLLPGQQMQYQSGLRWTPRRRTGL